MVFLYTLFYAIKVLSALFIEVVNYTKDELYVKMEYVHPKYTNKYITFFDFVFLAERTITG